MKTIGIIILSIIFVAGVLYKVFGPPVSMNAQEKEIRKRGVSMKAKVIQLMATGKMQGRHPELSLKLVMLPDTGENFNVEVTTFIAFQELSKIVPDSIISVKYSSMFPKSIVILK